LQADKYGFAKKKKRRLIIEEIVAKAITVLKGN
jgi:hypothetical protein